MSDSTLKTILSQYSKKKIDAEYEAEQRKQDYIKNILNFKQLMIN